MSEIGERMDNLITHLFDSIPDVTIVVSKLLPTSNKDGDDRVRNIINPQYEDVVRRNDKQRIVLADLYSAVTVEDLVDGIHPTDEGYKKLADVWLSAIYEAGKKVWLADYFEEDKDGGNLAFDGRVMEMLSEHTVEVCASAPAYRS